MKEFQPGLTNLTLWDDTYEKNLGQTSSSTSSLMTPEGSRVKQLQAGQTGTVSPSKAAPLNISIPHQSSSPHKFLPSLQHSGVDSSDFLKSLSVQERERRESEESTSTVSSQDNSFLRMLKQHTKNPRASQTNQTITTEVDMSRTMMDVSMFQHGDLTDTESVDSSSSKVDPGNFLANLASGKNTEDMMNMTNMSARMNQTKAGGQMDMTCVGGQMNQTRGGGRMDLTSVGGRMDLTCVGGQMDQTSVGGRMDLTCAGGQMELTRLGGGLDITLAAPALEKTRLGGQMNLTLSVDQQEEAEEETTNPRASRTVHAEMDMSQTMMDVSRFPHPSDFNESVEASPGNLKENVAETELATRMDMELTRVAGSTGSRDMMDLTRAGGRTNLTLTSAVPALEKTSLGGQMELTRSVGSLVSLATQGQEEDEDDMEITASVPQEDSVFHPAPKPANPLIARMSKQPTVAELPGSESSSANTSTECAGGATATVKFSGLSLANNTLILPRKESEEDEMTKCPVQYFYYDSSKPVTNQAPAEAIQPQSSLEVLVPPTGVESGQPSPSSSPCQAPGLTPDISSVAGAEEETPEMTTCLGGLAMQASKPQWDEELTSFLPREESTRAFNLASLRAEAASVEIPQPEPDIQQSTLTSAVPAVEKTSLGGQMELTGSVGSLLTACQKDDSVFYPAEVGEAGEITTFSPFSSTRVDDGLACLESPARQDRRKSEMVDVTRIESQPAGSSQQAETFLSGLEVTAAPGDCECHHMLGAVVASQDQHGLLCSNKRQSDQFQSELGLASPQKKLKLDQAEHQVERDPPDDGKAHSSTPDTDPDQQEDITITTSDETIKACEEKKVEEKAVETSGGSVADMVVDQEPTDQVLEVQSIPQPSECLTFEQVNTSIAETTSEDVPPTAAVEEKEEDGNIDVEGDKSLSSLEQIQSEKPAELATADKAEEESMKINVNQTEGAGVEPPREKVPAVPAQTPVEIDSVERVEDVQMEVSKEDKVQSPQQSPVEILLSKVSRAAPSKPEAGKLSQEVSIFQDLQIRRDSSASARSPNDWELQFSSEQFAAFTWLEGSLMVVLHLGEKLKPKKTRKSVGRVVHHWTISAIEIHPCHLDGPAPQNIEQHIIQAGESIFLSREPGTLSL